MEIKTKGAKTPKTFKKSKVNRLLKKLAKFKARTETEKRIPKIRMIINRSFRWLDLDAAKSKSEKLILEYPQLSTWYNGKTAIFEKENIQFVEKRKNRKK